jgi:NitT/TauT family transport system ATP-binding protein
MLDSRAGVVISPADEISTGRPDALRLRGVRKAHPAHGSGDERDLLVLDDIDLDVADGEFVTLIGPSGCGKSTLLNVIAGLEPYDAGEVIANGKKIHSSGPDIVMIFQEDALFPWLSVAGNVEFGLREKGLPKDERRKIAARFIEMVNLTPFANSYVHQLSGGMKQRVAIARGLALDPLILLMEEPFGALDARTREGMQNHIQTIHSQTKKTILFVTHDVREAACLGDRIVLFTHRPARIKREFKVALPRPRRSEDPALHAIIDAVLQDLKEEGDETDEFAGR